MYPLNHDELLALSKQNRTHLKNNKKESDETKNKYSKGNLFFVE